MPYQKTKEGRLVNEVTLGDGYPLSNDKQPLKVGGEASIINVSSPTPDNSVDGEVEVKGKLKAKDTFIQGNLKCFTEESTTPQFVLESKQGVNSELLVRSAANSRASLKLRNSQGYFELRREYSTTSLQFTDGTNTPLTLDGNNVGIGRAASSYNLDVDGSSRFLGTASFFRTAFPQINLSDDSGTDIMNIGHSGDVFYFKTSDTINDVQFRRSDNEDVLRIDMSESRVGIGTNSPSEALDVAGNINLTGDILLASEKKIQFASADTKIYTNADSPEDLYIESDDDIYIRADDNLVIAEGTNNYVTFKGGERAVDITGDLFASSKIGIGTTSPSTLLELQDDANTFARINTSGSGLNSGVQFYDNDVYKWQVYNKASDDSLRFKGSSDFVSIDSSGNVGIGLTAPTTTLDVEGTVSYKHTAFTTAGPTDNVDVSDTTVLEVDTSSNNVIIGGFTGGVQGQILYIVKTNTANFIQLEHNEGGGSQDIFITTGSDERVVGYGGYTLYCNGTSWFSLSNPTGGSDAG